MKAFYFLVAITLIYATNALPKQGENQENSDDTKCRLTSIFPKGSISVPDLDSDEPSVHEVEDPLILNNASVTINEKLLTGTYSFGNGVLEGLSTHAHDFSYNPIGQRFSVNGTIGSLKLTGNYEVINGAAYLSTLLGNHTFSGQGPLTTTVTGVTADIGVSIRIDPQTQYISVTDLKLDADYETLSFVAENFVVDGVPVNWDEINKNIRAIYENIWLGAHAANVQVIQNTINGLLEGCTVMDLIELARPPQT